MGRLQGALGRLRPVEKFHPPVFVAALSAAQGGQINQLPQQPGDGRQGGFFDVL